MEGAMSPADLSAVMGNNNECFGGGGAWWIIILFLFCFAGGGGMWGNNAATAATTADIQRAVDLNSIQRGQADLAADVQRTTYETISSVKDAAYNNLSETRDVQAGMAAGFANLTNGITAGFDMMQKCCCETQRAIDGVNYNVMAQSSAVQANDTANTQKILDAIANNRMADMQNQINALQLQAAMCGVVRYPIATTYNAGNWFGCGCNSNNI